MLFFQQPPSYNVGDMKQSLEDKSLMTARHNKRKWNGKPTLPEGASKLNAEPLVNEVQPEANTTLNTTPHAAHFSGNSIFITFMCTYGQT